jgi:hypothetical protein
MPGRNDWIDILTFPYAHDTFSFTDDAKSSRDGVVVAAHGADDARLPCTPDWSDPRMGDPGPCEYAAAGMVALDDNYAGSHALYQDLTVPT